MARSGLLSRGVISCGAPSCSPPLVRWVKGSVDARLGPVYIPASRPDPVLNLRKALFYLCQRNHIPYLFVWPKPSFPPGFRIAAYSVSRGWSGLRATCDALGARLSGEWVGRPVEGWAPYGVAYGTPAAAGLRALPS